MVTETYTHQCIQRNYRTINEYFHRGISHYATNSCIGEWSDKYFTNCSKSEVRNKTYHDNQIINPISKW